MSIPTVEELKALAKPDADLQELLNNMGPVPPVDFNALPEMRAGRQKMYAEALERCGNGEPHCKESYLKIPMRDGHEARAKLWTPSAPAEGGSPLAVLYFGGGFIMGDCEQLTTYARDLCRLFGVTVLAPNYRLSPENPFPAAPHDAWDALVFASEHAAEWGADIKAGFVVGGISAGGNLAASMSLQAAVERDIGLTGAWLAVPVIFSSDGHVPDRYKHLYISYEQNRDAPILNRNATDNMMSQYAPDLQSPMYSVTMRGDDAMRKMPRTYFQVSGLDPLRDDAVIFDLVLRDLGVETRLDHYPGMVHAHFGFFPDLPQSIKARTDFASGFAWLLRAKAREDAQAGQPWFSVGG